MLELQGIDLGPALFVAHEFELYPGRFLGGERSPCLVKAPRAGQLDAAHLARIYREIRIARSLKGGAPPLLEVRSHRLGPIQVLAHPGGELLSHILERGRLLPLEQCLRIAIALTRAVEEIHGVQVVHRSIAPERIFVDASGGRAALFDFSRATRLSRLNRQRERFTEMPQSLRCMAPEQSGRTNRDSDHRTDLYSLGVTLFWIFAGRPPFEASSPGEWIYMHLASTPPKLSAIRPEAPEMLDRVFARLLAKDPEERYRGATGLRHDLETAEASFLHGGDTHGLSIAVADPPERFTLSQRLYGRERELGALTHSLEQARQGRLCAALVRGEAGSGKSALIREVETNAIRHGMLFGFGRFEALDRNRPFRGWIQAAERLLQDVTAAGGATAARVRAGLQGALGENGGALVSLIPELAGWLGKQSDTQDLSPAEARNRLNYLFLTFFREIAAGGRSVALALDDLQWADGASLDLLRSLFQTSDTNIAVLLAARPDNGYAGERLSAALEELRRAGAEFREIELKALRAEDLGRLISDSLASPMDDALHLAAAVHVRTGGNAFYSLRLLYAGAGEGWIHFDSDARRWRWNIEGMGAVAPTSITEFLVSRIAIYTERTREALGIAAHLGAEVAEAMLNAVWSALQSGAAVDALEEALADGLVSVREEDERRFIEFAHDRVQEAAATLIAPERVAYVRLHAGRFLLERWNREHRQGLFAIVDHLTHSPVAALAAQERDELIALTIEAARMALGSSAWEHAAEYSRAAVRLLGDEGWQAAPQESAQAWSLALESEYLIGDAASAEERFAVIVDRCRDVGLLAEVHQKLVILYTNQGRHEEAIRLGIRALRLLGVKIAENPGKAPVLVELMRLEFSRRRLSAEDLRKLPPMKNSRRRMIMEVLMALAPPAFFTRQNLFAIVSLRMARYSVQFGRAETTGYAFMVYAALLVSPLGRYAEADRVGRVALELNEMVHNSALRSRLLVVFGAFVSHWQSPLRLNHSFLRRAFRAGLESGDLVYAGYALANRIFASAARGEALSEVVRLAESFLRFTDRTGDRDVEGDFLLALHSAARLSGVPSSTLQLRNYDAARHLERMQSGNPVTFFFRHFLELRDACLSGDVDQAVDAIVRSAAVSEPAQPLAIGFAFEVYVVAALSALGRRQSLSRPQRRRLALAQRKITTWRKKNSAPHFETYERFAFAEAASDAGRNGEALAAFSRAQQCALRDEDLPLAALAALRLADLLHRSEAAALAEAAKSDARIALERWGADALLNQLGLRRLPVVRESAVAGFSAVVASALHAARGISQEITLERLAPRALESIMIVSGARRGALLTPNDNGALRLRALGQSAESLRVESANDEINAHSFLPAGLLHRVYSTRNALTYFDAREDLAAEEAPAGARSLHCAPVIERGAVIGVLYLDNDLAPGVFSPDRIELIALLAAQAASALENARLYGQLEQRVADRTRELEQSLRQVRDLKLQQDLDYYLISLLVEPLSSVRFDDPRLEVEAFTRQLKQFQFKLWSEQIGGDITLVRHLAVGPRGCAAFINADAMGKSLQGAGGALVLAAVFEALTVSGQSAQTTPEDWLNHAYVELNRVFAIFNGYMMASCVLGLADAESGEVWLSISDHPAPVLIQDGVARLLSDAPGAPRLGMSDAPNTAPVYRFTLQPGDSLIVATDGRDDLLIDDALDGADESAGERSMLNSAEAFLSVVETADARPAEIYQTLNARGELTDDISILRLHRPMAARAAIAASK